MRILLIDFLYAFEKHGSDEGFIIVVGVIGFDFGNFRVVPLFECWLGFGVGVAYTTLKTGGSLLRIHGLYVFYTNSTELFSEIAIWQSN